MELKYDSAIQSAFMINKPHGENALTVAMTIITIKNSNDLFISTQECFRL